MTHFVKRILLRVVWREVMLMMMVIKDSRMTTQKSKRKTWLNRRRRMRSRKRG